MVQHPANIKMQTSSFLFERRGVGDAHAAGVSVLAHDFAVVPYTPE